MVIVKLQGGLGNQMFQYATARSICKGFEKVILDPSFLLENHTSTEFFTARRYELEIFKNLNARLANTFWQQIIHNKRVYFRAAKKIICNNFRYVKQVGNEILEFDLNKGSTLYLDGYFQSEKYFHYNRNQLLQEFAFSSLDIENITQLNQIQSYSNPVSIHIRRGDYLKPHVLNYHGILPINYYKKAIEALETTVSNPHYFIFSDDIGWCRENLSFISGRYTIMEVDNSRESWKDMCLMTHCKHHIVANSSFSWWGAWLSQKKGINMAPYKWFNPAVVSFNIHDFVPSSWSIVNYE
ncbi:alpha-1,2-fucosyltransferase [Chitinophagaceae bacterium LB-8]|uniref:Alpha-1,2-fucosyltransferase n=1 Tax=Paraflavisolibacter caeni TaxID=2982496 RepID=A0A9X2XXP4_9BACT|nr:alpha-1,2-fucosyltransferase [Paraflavisolibacter caeni]MCU7551291.1 alpha-1,2-fucosyltransferase [Paraflavisolibacter caeni]